MRLSSIRIAVLLAVSLPALGFAALERCGWIENPTPGNWSLLDRDGSWTLPEQGGDIAEGFDAMPDMSTRGWVERNGTHGYSCLRADTDRSSRRVTRLFRAWPLPIKR